MIKKIKSWGHLNYVDHKNNFVGAETKQQCCECFHVLFSAEDWDKINYDIRGDEYDKMKKKNKYFENQFANCEFTGIAQQKEISLNIYTKAWLARFEIKNVDTSEKFWMYISNYHNGCYSHFVESTFGVFNL